MINLFSHETIKDKSFTSRIELEKEMFLFLHNNNVNISLDEAVEYTKQLEDNNYVEIKDSYLLYKKDADISEYIESKLENKLNDVKEVLRLIDKEELAQLWLDEIFLEDAIGDMSVNLSIEQVLDKPLEMAYKSINDNEIYYIKL